ncbi:hypothetical protein ACKWTF_015696 [Chironomus riparius]
MRRNFVALIFLIILLSVPDDETLNRNMLEIRLNYHLFERNKVMERLAIEEESCGEIEPETFLNETVVSGKLYTVVEEEFEGLFVKDEKQIIKYVYVTIIVNF